MSDLMDDFDWQAAKVCHAVLLIKMEEDKVTWGDTNKIDRIRRVHAQKVHSGQASGLNSKTSVKHQPHVGFIKKHLWTNPRP